MVHGSATADRPAALDRALSGLLESFTGIEAAAVVSYDGLPMASALPAPMDENRVAAMSAALLSLGERAAEGLGRGELSEVFIEGADGTVCLVSCGQEAVLVAVAEQAAKIGLVLFEVRHCAATIAAILQHEVPEPPLPTQSAQPVAALEPPTAPWSTYAPVGTVLPGEPVATP
jgi:predicted regulator of Ras-like GTPase activity (Roadblock/LC7/MglB family)